ncbi:MarR family winged helix-turn-helix transcriptional regulator [Paracoccus lutimaris]|uniref:MarR family transcriptional regulator for hemolysin n=1 Tax=Paracoccus lutimaris TaxID=1490030 RepID=A0A368YRL1_9RHOB|nr:MarR family transcriptional regulator [Paracoccus lutimaris]RCW82833.1 MarR family transcriptional regulator for hemolysin [Paracoccus lutimaris]
MPQSPAPLFETILYLTRAIRAGFELRVRAQGLTYARARLLAVIGHNQGASQAELAQRLDIETPTLKRQLDALEALGLAERRPLAEDGRKHAIFLTGAARIEPLLAFRAEVEAAFSDGIAPEDLATTRRVLARMAENAERLKRT